MNTDRRRWPGASALALLISLVGTSCGEQSKIPPADIARNALETSLAAWRDGKKPNDLMGTTPPIQAVDTEWNNGRKLVSFEILRPEPSETDKRFVVKLAYAGAAPAAEAEVKYIVIGSSPVSVYREEDFTRTMNMENNPTGKPKKKR
jgi:hypothetical protein